MKPFIPNVSRDNRQGEVRRPNVPPPNLQQNNAAQRPIQSMHRFATTTKLSVIKRTYAVNLALTMN